MADDSIKNKGKTVPSSDLTGEFDLPMTPNLDSTSESAAQAEEHSSLNRIEPVFSVEPTAALDDPSYRTPEPISPDPHPAEPLSTSYSLGRDVSREIEKLKPSVQQISTKDSALSGDETATLRKYLTLKEQEVRDLKDQQIQYQGFVKKASVQIESLSKKTREFLQDLDESRKRESAIQKELIAVRENREREMVALRNEYEDKLRAAGTLEARSDEFQRVRDEWKTKIREDLKRIKLKEKELENKTELLKRDMQALLDSKDKHILELRKKNDAIELDLESLEDRLRRYTAILGAIESKKNRLVETFRLAISLLESIDAENKAEASETSRKVG